MKVAAARGRAGSTAEKSLVHRIRSFQWSEPANRKCADCSERGPTYICLTFQTFVCQTCSGIHRSFGHKIKGISLSDWSVKELEALEAGGNARAAAAWLARWTANEFPEPDSSQTERVKEFIKRKYVDKSWWREPKNADTGEGQQVRAALRVPASPAGLRPTKDPPAGERRPPAPASLLDAEAPGLLGLTPPPPPGPALLAAAPGAAEARAEWTADFSSHVPDAVPLATPIPTPTTAPVAAPSAGGLLDIDFGAAAVPQAVEAPAAIIDFGALGANTLSDVAKSPAPAANKEGLAGPADGLAGLDFGSPAPPPGTNCAALMGLNTLNLKGPSTCSSSLTTDLFDVAFGAAAGVPAPLPNANVATGFVESPLMEPAEEPAPTLAANSKEETGTIGDRLREAVLSSSSDEMKNLFRECLEPTKRPATDDRFAAFAAFDELSAGGSSHSKTEVVGQQYAVPHEQQRSHIPPPGPAPGLGPPVLGGLATGMLGGGLAGMAEPQPCLGGVPMPTSPGSQGPVGTQHLTSMTTQQMGQVLQQGGMVAPHQLDHLNQQELMQMQIMISQAMQARAQQQRMAAAAAGQPTSPHGSAPTPSLGGAGHWQPAPGPGGSSSGPFGTAGGPAAQAGTQAAQRAPSPPKEFGDLLAAFHARNPINGIELKA